MIELEFLGLNADGDKLTFNDPEGNRYQVGISDELSAAVRKLQLGQKSTNSSSTPLKYRDIQQLLRAGRDLEELAVQTDIPTEQLDKIAYPILAEREYRARNAQSFMPAGEDSGMTLAELVEARLLTRSVNPNQIRWDATREANSPWILWAYYSVKEEQLCAKWAIDEAKQSLRALNDEAAWITENPLKASNEPWRPLNTPKVSAIDLMTPTINTVPEASATPSSSSDSSFTAPGTDSLSGTVNSAQEESNVSPVSELGKISDKQGDPTASLSANTDETTAELPDFSAAEPAPNTGLDLDAILAELDAQRGVAKPMPSVEEFTEGAHPAASEPELATDATIIQLQPVADLTSDSAAESIAEEDSLDAEDDFSESIEEHEIPNFADFTADPETDPADFADFSETPGDTVSTPDSANESNAAELDSAFFSTTDDEEPATANDSSAANIEVAEVDPAQAELPGFDGLKEDKAAGKENSGKESTGKASKPKSRRDRPAMPSWDEIVFGYSKD